MKLLKEYIKQIITESANEEDLAALVLDIVGGGKKVIIYDSFLLWSELSQFDGGSPVEIVERGFNALLGRRVIKGYLQVGPPPETVGRDRTHIDTGECYDAWMVYKSAGPGMGRYVYGLGYALSPTGLLIPDREIVSPSARSGWKKQAKKRGIKPLDDITLPPHARRTPDDPHDDCAPQDEDTLNYAYEGGGEDARLLKLLTWQHNDAMGALGPAREQAERWLETQGDKFFWRHFSGVG